MFVCSLLWLNQLLTAAVFGFLCFKWWWQTEDGGDGGGGGDGDGDNADGDGKSAALIGAISGPVHGAPVNTGHHFRWSVRRFTPQIHTSTSTSTNSRLS